MSKSTVVESSRYVCPIHSDQACAVADGRNPHALFNDLPSVTQQSFKDECDINGIMDRARKGMAITHVNTRVAEFGDVSTIPDYRTALDDVRRAQGLFMQLDASVRKRFENDPAKFLDFVNNPENRVEASELGLLKPEVVQAIKDSAVAVEQAKIDAAVQAKWDAVRAKEAVPEGKAK